MKTLKCQYCSAEFKAKKAIFKFCSSKCKDLNRIKLKSEKLIKEGVEGEDYVIDQWNGFATRRIYGVWFKSMHPDKELSEYKKEFPDSPLTCLSDKKATSKNSGKHMKEEKYRKMVSEKVKGKNNPNHSSKTSKEERQKRSPWSPKFKKYQGLDNPEVLARENMMNGIKDRLTETNYEYWLDKTNGNEKEAKKLYSERQRTFTLDKCIEKHGEEMGRKIWKDRQDKWSQLMTEKYNNGEYTKFNKNNYSKIEGKFVTELVNNLGLDNSEYVSCINGKQFFRTFKDEGMTLSYDFKYKKKIIEFNGDYWHMNPDKYNKDDFNHNLRCTAEEKWNMDRKKINLIESEGYQVLTVWEGDYSKNPDKVIQDCIEFLRS